MRALQGSVRTGAIANLPTRRSITPGEKSLLRGVFETTIPLEDVEVAANVANLGGVHNSATPASLPMFSTDIWCEDFSAASVCNAYKGTFIHEFMHVWQDCHGISKIIPALWLFVRHAGDYALAYPYDLSNSPNILDYNIEQQAVIIEDWWRITQSMSPLNNIGVDKAPLSYARYIAQVRGAGLPHTPARPPLPRYNP